MDALYKTTANDRKRIKNIKDTINKWPCVSDLTANDLMPDIVYLLERLECAEEELKKLVDLSN